MVDAGARHAGKARTVGKRTSYAPGTFAWADLRTTDLADARRFYAELFGWSYTDSDPDGSYVSASVEGAAVAGLKSLGAAGGSPFWLNYVAVDDADAAAARTRELGGTVHTEPFDRGAGWLTVISDPTGGWLCLWESRGIGACRVNEPGCLTWHELRTNDVPAVIPFYMGMFGWRIGHDGVVAGRNGGVRELDGAVSWVPYFAVDSLDEALARASDEGGRILAGPLDIPDGRSAIVRDPQGAEFGLVEGRLDG